MKKRLKTGLLSSFFMVCLLWHSCKKNEYEGLDCDAINASYSKDIKPIVEANCLESGCHNSSSVHGDFTEYKGLKGKANNGSLNKRVLEKKDMPSGGKLSLEDRKKIKCWLNSGFPEN